MIALITLLSTLASPLAHAGPDDLAYFKQFEVKKESISSDPDFPEYQYRYLMANEIKFINSNQQNVIGNASLQLFDDGHFVYTYREMVEMVMPGAPAGTPPSVFPHGCKTFSGQWSVPAELLVLPLVGSGGRDYIANELTPQAVKVTFEQDFLSAGLKGQAATFTYGISNVPDDTQFCF